MRLEKPKRPRREECFSDKQYLDRLKAYKRERRKWINQNRPKAKKADKSQEIIKKRRKYRTMKDSEFKKKQLDKSKQRRIA